MLFSSHLTVMFFAYSPNNSNNIRHHGRCRLLVCFVCFLHFECVDFVGVVTFDRGTTSKEVCKSERNCPGQHNITPICCTSFQVYVYFSKKSKQRISLTKAIKTIIVIYKNNKNILYKKCTVPLIIGTFSIKNLQYLQKINSTSNNRNILYKNPT